MSATPTAAVTRDLPDSVRARSAFSAVDYADLASLATDVRATPEHWARAMFGDVPNAKAVFIWSGLLGLRLQREPGPDTVAGWRIDGRGDRWIRMAAASWFLSGELVVSAADGQVSLATFLRYDRRLAHLVWPPLSVVHRSLVPGLLADAALRVAARDPRRLSPLETG